jgi:hypothetical protein
MIFGNTSTFGIKVASISESGEYGDVHIWLNGEQIGIPPDVLPIFVNWLEDARRAHEKMCPASVDLSTMTDSEVYERFEPILKGNGATGVEENWFWEYHLLHSLADALDCYNVFIVDDGPYKRIVWKAICSDFPQNHIEKVWGVKVSRYEFNDTLKSFHDWYGSKFPDKVRVKNRS